MRLVHAFISSKLDYCNALLYGLPDSDINRLQSIQNAAARLVSGTKKYEHIVPVLISLHWLPVKARIEYKILLITYKIITDCCPLYLKNMLCFSNSNYDLRSTSSNLLRQPRSKTKHYADRGFLMLRLICGIASRIIIEIHNQFNSNNPICKFLSK